MSFFGGDWLINRVAVDTPSRVPAVPAPVVVETWDPTEVGQDRT